MTALEIIAWAVIMAAFTLLLCWTVVVSFA